MAWLDPEYGSMVLSIESDIVDALHLLKASRNFFNLDVLVSARWGDVLLPDIPAITSRIFKDLGVVATWSLHPETWDDQLISFCNLG